MVSVLFVVLEVLVKVLGVDVIVNSRLLLVVVILNVCV